MKHLQKFYPEAKFGGFSDIDGTFTFYNRVHSLLNANFIVLDVGCGRGALEDDPVFLRRNLRIFKNKVSKVIGIDVDENASINPYIDEFRMIQSDVWPIMNNTIDLIICDGVLEHFENPNIFFSESSRVLKDKGFLCIRTSNLWNYIAILSRLIPHKYHSRVLSIAQNKRKEEDIFQTYYRCNTITKIKKTMKKYEYESVVYGFESEPSYFEFSAIAYAVGYLHQKLAPNYFKEAIFAFGKINK